jgi:hypothetical protein
MKRVYSQIKPRRNNYVTVNDTTWIYPEVNVAAALATTTFPYTYDGDFITCPDIASIAGIYNAIWNSTAISQPIGSNPGYSIGVGTLLEDQGKELRFRLTSGQVIIVWRLVKQLTPQTAPPANVIPVPGNSTPNGTVGFVTTYISYGRAALSPNPSTFDDANVVKSG